MTIKELAMALELLIKQGHAESEVFLSRDEEGNAFHKMLPPQIDSATQVVFLPDEKELYDYNDDFTKLIAQ